MTRDRKPAGMGYLAPNQLLILNGVNTPFKIKGVVDAKEAQTEFLTLMEDAIRQTDLAKSVQRYQLAVDEAKVRLNLAVRPGAWLMPARMIINTESTAGYDNKLKQAKVGMKLGINNDVNSGTKKAALQLMDGGPSKIAPPNSHP